MSFCHCRELCLDPQTNQTSSALVSDLDPFGAVRLRPPWFLQGPGLSSAMYTKKTPLARSEYVSPPSHSETETRSYSIQAPACLRQKQQWMDRQTLSYFLGCVSPAGTWEASAQPQTQRKELHRMISIMRLRSPRPSCQPCLIVLISLYSLHQPARNRDDPCLVHELRKADGLARTHTLQLISTEGKLGQMRVSS